MLFLDLNMIRMNLQDSKNAEIRINKGGKMRFVIQKVSTSASISQKNITLSMKNFTSIQLLTLIVILKEVAEEEGVVIVAIEVAEEVVEVVEVIIMKLL